MINRLPDQIYQFRAGIYCIEIRECSFDQPKIVFIIVLTFFDDIWFSLSVI